jgi:hypothetical protein
MWRANRILGHENAVQADQSEDFRYVTRRIANSEVVAFLAGSGVDRNQGGYASCVDAFDGAEVEDEALVLDQRHDALQEPLIVTPDQFR